MALTIEQIANIAQDLATQYGSGLEFLTVSEVAYGRHWEDVSESDLEIIYDEALARADEDD